MKSFLNGSGDDVVAGEEGVGWETDFYWLKIGRGEDNGKIETLQLYNSIFASLGENFDGALKNQRGGCARK